MELNLATRQLLFANRRHKGEFQYTLPSPNYYPYQWLWDSCFHAIILSHFSLPDAKKEILSLISKQFDNGMIPHIIYWQRGKKTQFPVIKWGKNKTSSITQPPMIAYAVWQIYQKDKDTRFVESVYPNLYHYYRYLLTERDPHEKHLVGILNPDESGEDNSPRFDLSLGLPPKQTIAESRKKRFELVRQNIECNFDAPFCMRKFFWVKDVPFNSIMAENLKKLSKLAEKLGHKEDASYFFEEADKISEAMKKWMMEDGLLYSTWKEDYEKIKVKTWAIFAPLFANLLSQTEAKKLVEDHLLNTHEFWAQYPVTTVSMDEPPYNPEGFWRGSTWIAINWFIYKGLLNYSFKDIANQLKQKSQELIQKSGFREYFNPQNGEGLGAENFTWGGLVIDMD